MRNSALLGPYGRTMHRALRWVLGGGHFVMSQVTLHLYSPRRHAVRKQHQQVRLRLAVGAAGGRHLRRDHQVSQLWWWCIFGKNQTHAIIWPWLARKSGRCRGRAPPTTRSPGLTASDLWHTQDSQSQILALACTEKFWKL